MLQSPLQLPLAAIVTTRLERGKQAVRYIQDFQKALFFAGVTSSTA